MYTPSELREKVLKLGIKGDKRDAEQFISELSSYILKLQQENEDLKKNVKDLTDSISYYKSIEKTLQKALVLAEKTAQDIKSTALKDAEAIEEKARNRARRIQLEASKKLMLLEQKTLNLIHQYDSFRIQFINLLNSQHELLNNQSFQINTDDFLYKEDKLQDASVNDPEVDIEAGYEADETEGNNPNTDFMSESKPASGQTYNYKGETLVRESGNDSSEQALDDGFEIIHVLDEDN